MSDFVLDASLALQWFLEDEADRKYSLAVLVSLSEKRAMVPLLWFYEVGSGLLMAHRRKRITLDQIGGFLTRLKALPMDAAQQIPSAILELPALALSHSLTNYDAPTSPSLNNTICLSQRWMPPCGEPQFPQE